MPVANAPAARRPQRNKQRAESLKNSRRVARRRAKRARHVAHLRALEDADKIAKLAFTVQDMQAAAELHKAANGLRLRYGSDENDRRLAVLHALEECLTVSPLVTASEIVLKTRLPLGEVVAILEDFSAPDVDLVSIHTMGGRRNSGRGGTVLYYKLRR